MAKKALSLMFISVVFLVVFLASANAVTGVQNVTLSNYSGNVVPGGNITVRYGIKSVSGYYTFATTLYVVNNKQLIAHNISVLLTARAGNPPLNGTMYVFALHTTPLGNYNVTLGGNSSNSTVNPAVLRFSVLGSLPSSSTSTTSVTPTASTVATTVSTVLPTTVSVATTTILASPVSSGSTTYAVVILVIIVIVALIFWKSRGNSGKKPAPPQQGAQKPAPKPPEKDVKPDLKIFQNSNPKT